VFEKFAGEHFPSRVEPNDGGGAKMLTPAIMGHELAAAGSTQVNNRDNRTSLGRDRSSGASPFSIVTAVRSSS
jgi:hypothetical protein